MAKERDRISTSHLYSLKYCPKPYAKTITERNGHNYRNMVHWLALMYKAQDASASDKIAVLHPPACGTRSAVHQTLCENTLQWQQNFVLS